METCSNTWIQVSFNKNLLFIQCWKFQLQYFLHLTPSLRPANEAVYDLKCHIYTNQTFQLGASVVQSMKIWQKLPQIKKTTSEIRS